MSSPLIHRVGATLMPDPGRVIARTDRLNQTILVVEAAKPVPWTAPVDISFTPAPAGFSPASLGGQSR